MKGADPLIGETFGMKRVISNPGYDAMIRVVAAEIATALAGAVFLFDMAFTLFPSLKVPCAPSFRWSRSVHLLWEAKSCAGRSPAPVSSFAK